MTTGPEAEWLETDGLGGFASGTASGLRTRRYHALLLTAQSPPTRRVVLMNAVEAHVATQVGVFPISSHRYEGGVTHPAGHRYLESFSYDPWLAWVYRLPDGTRVQHEVVVPRDIPAVILKWRLLEGVEGVTVSVRPLLSGRDYHALHHENPDFRFNARVERDRVSWQPYGGLPRIHAWHNGAYAHAPLWFHRFQYDEELARGFDGHEDLASPGEFRWSFAAGEAVLALSTAPLEGRRSPRAMLQREAQRRAAASTPLERAAEHYLVRRGNGRSIIAGYPWFADWGRDTFVALRGLCLATGRLDDAERVLLTWGEHLSNGMLPNRFPDDGDTPEYNSVDASLWYAVAALEYVGLRGWRSPTRGAGSSLLEYVSTILDHYARGTRHGIASDDDGLLRAGEPGVQLTWMDARVGGREVTPRIGKPVDVQALWLNALVLAGQHDGRWDAMSRRAGATFRRRFVQPRGDALYDVIDVDHRPAAVDATFRPNQLFAVGGLPLMLLDLTTARRVVDEVERRLWTPMGLRSLDPGDPAYAGRYTGGPAERDAVYHQGTVWPWLTGPFVEAWVRVRLGTPSAKLEARRRFVEPLLDHLGAGGLGHVSEIADGDAPHTARGCPFQAWSVGELLRLTRVVLATDPSPSAPGTHRTPIFEGATP